jgi:hypothetical protein
MPTDLALGSFSMNLNGRTLNGRIRWRAAVLAAAAAVSLSLTGCTDETPADNPDTEQEDGNGDQEDDDGD